MSNSTESPFSSNFRMYRDGADFQFTVRQDDIAAFMDALDNLIPVLQKKGWSFPAQVAQAQQQPVAQKSVPMSGQQPVPPGAPLALPAATHAAPGAQTGAPKMDGIEGYVLGTYLSKKTQQVEPAVWLYTSRRPYKAYTVYPEDFGLLPFAVPSDMSRFVNGSAPSREQAMGRGVYNVHPFQLPTVAQTNPDGTVVVNAKGYVEYRPARRHELEGGSGTPVVQQTSAAQAQATVHVSQAAPFKGVTEFDVQVSTPPPDALAWSMQDADDAVSGMGMLDDVEEWFKQYRTQVVGYMPMGGKKTGDQQWQLLNEWCALQVGKNSGDMVEVTDMGHLPLAGLLVGIVCDRYAEKAAEAPVEVVVDILRRVSPQRGTETNPSFDPVFAGALSRIFQTEYERVSIAGNLAF